MKWHAYEHSSQPQAKLASRAGDGPAAVPSGDEGSDKDAETKELEASSVRQPASAGMLSRQQSLVRTGSSRSLHGGSSQHSRSAMEAGGDSGRQEASDSDRDDTGSRCASTKYCPSGQQTTPDKLKGQSLVNYWVGQMPLQQILHGKKVGVPVHQSELAMRRLEPKHQLQLRSHMQCVQWCQLLCVHGIHLATAAQIKAALEGLADCGLRLPTELMRHLWSGEFAQRAHRVTTDLSEVAVQEFLECCLPYSTSTSQPAEFDWKHPRLCQTALEHQEKANMFLECVLDRGLVDLVLQGQDSMEKAKLFSKWLMQVLFFFSKPQTNRRVLSVRLSV